MRSWRSVHLLRTLGMNFLQRPARSKANFSCTRSPVPLEFNVGRRTHTSLCARTNTRTDCRTNPPRHLTIRAHCIIVRFALRYTILHWAIKIICVALCFLFFRDVTSITRVSCLDQPSRDDDHLKPSLACFMSPRNG